MNIPKLVIDTNVIVSALKSKQGTSHALFRLIGKGKLKCNISVPLVLEYEKVLLDPSLEIPFTKEEIEKILNFLCANSKHHKIYFLWRPYLKDEKDDMVLELAVSSNSDYIITFNKKDFVGVEKFGISILGRNTKGNFRKDGRNMMNSISIRLPDSLHKAAIELAKKEHISINQFISTAVAEKISALMTEDYLMKRAKNAPTREEFDKLLEKVPDVEPEEYDKL